MIYDKKLKECEDNIEMLIEKGQYLFYQLDKTLQTLKLINQDLSADRQAEDAYQSEREAIKYMEQREIERAKFGEINPDYEQAKADQETVADDVLRAAGFNYNDNGGSK